MTFADAVKAAMNGETVYRQDAEGTDIIMRLGSLMVDTRTLISGEYRMGEAKLLEEDVDAENWAVKE